MFRSMGILTVAVLVCAVVGVPVDGLLRSLAMMTMAAATVATILGFPRALAPLGSFALWLGMAILAWPLVTQPAVRSAMLILLIAISGSLVVHVTGRALLLSQSLGKQRGFIRPTLRTQLPERHPTRLPSIDPPTSDVDKGSTDDLNLFGDGK